MTHMEIREPIVAETKCSGHEMIFEWDAVTFWRSSRSEIPISDFRVQDRIRTVEHDVVEQVILNLIRQVVLGETLIKRTSE